MSTSTLQKSIVACVHARCSATEQKDELSNPISKKKKRGIKKINFR
jgi:predicted site-specific integrase-resolvase